MALSSAASAAAKKVATTAAATTSTNSAISSTFFLKHGLPLITNIKQNIYSTTGKWILLTGGSVIGMIHVGGITRLTQSGLSMTNWSPLGTLPPITHDEWLIEFNRYKTFPEYTQRSTMTLSEFKYIYGWEYGHRMLGRSVGLLFAIPWMYFTIKRKIPNGYQKRMFGLLCMGGTQGLVGWWMVKSGLGDDRRNDKYEIRVKPIRLTTHLTMAVITYGALLKTGLDILSLPHTTSTKIQEQISKLSKDILQHTKRLRVGSIFLCGITGITIVSGALVAGNDAGKAYNTFPKMNNDYIPPLKELLGDGEKYILPWYKNLYENTTLVQFNHRVLGCTTAITALSLTTYGLLKKSATKALLVTPQTRVGLLAVGVTSVGQVTLGITTLLNYVPMTLAAAHQLGSIAVFTSSIYLVHSLRFVKWIKIPKLTSTNAMLNVASKKVATAAGTTTTASRGVSTSTAIGGAGLRRTRKRT